MNRFIFLTMVLRTDGTVTTNSGMHSEVIYRLLGNICCADRSWIFIFWSWKSHGKSMLKKRGHPVGRLGGIDPWKYVGGSQSMFWHPLKISHSFIQKLLSDNSACKFQVIKDERLVSKMEGKIYFFWGTWNCLMAWPDWSRPPYFTTDLRHWETVWRLIVRLSCEFGSSPLFGW